MKDCMATTGLVQGIWLTFITLGGIIGPLAGGYISEHIGFVYTTLCVIGLMFLMFLLTVAYIVKTKANFKITPAAKSDNSTEDKPNKDVKIAKDNAGFILN